jgi:ABC-type transport system involved in cytochrome bd biosynthesis fused ATPase/permease subunit
VHRSITLRLLEPLSAPVEEPGPPASDAVETTTGRAAAAGMAAVPGGASSGGVAIRMTGVHVRTAGSFILDGIDLDIPAGAHVAIVGPSGAGKSSLMGLLLGFHRPAEGVVEVDGAPLQDETLRSLRRLTVWIDPAVQLWNRTLLENLSYGSNSEPASALASVIQASDLRGVVEHLETGLQTPLGEGGRLLSGGEGQRVRVGRGLLHPRARLVLLDEGFRGLDREQRRRLLKMAREWWPDATLLFATHDVADTLTFDRVLVMRDRRIHEDGVPSTLAAASGSLYRAFLAAEAAGASAVESATAFRRMRLEEGSLRTVTAVEGAG